MMKFDDINIIKIGTNAITKKGEDGRCEIDREAIRDIAVNVEHLINEGRYCFIMSSGAIMLGKLGKNGFGYEERDNSNLDVTELQYYAGLGQYKMVAEYDNAFSRQVMQMLFTAKKKDNGLDGSVAGLSIDELELVRKENRCRIMRHCMEKGNVVVGNYDDPTHDMEVRYDNDTTTGLVAAAYNSINDQKIVRAVFLGTEDGIYRDFENRRGIIGCVDSKERLHECYSSAGKSDENSLGGAMKKIAAAHYLAERGVETHIANVNHLRGCEDGLRKIIDNEVKNTVFRGA